MDCSPGDDEVSFIEEVGPLSSRFFEASSPLPAAAADFFAFDVGAFGVALVVGEDFTAAISPFAAFFAIVGVAGVFDFVCLSLFLPFAPPAVFSIFFGEAGGLAMGLIGVFSAFETALRRLEGVVAGVGIC